MYIVAPLQDSHCPSFSQSNSQCLDGPVQDFKGGGGGGGAPEERAFRDHCSLRAPTALVIILMLYGYVCKSLQN